jgi:hypothetical protein
MRGVRSLLVLLVIAAVVGWFTYREYQKPADADTPKKDKVFAVDAEKIDEITITSEAGERTRLQKSGDQGWQIVEPVAVAPDPAEVSGLTTNLSTLEIERVVDENAPDLKEYGLADPRIQLAFGAGGETHTLLVGSKTPPGTDLYAKRGGDNKVFLLPGHLDSTFNKSTFDLRDKTVLKVDREKVDVLEVTADGRTTKFTRPEAEWQIAEPAGGRADFGAIDGLVSRLTGLQMRSIVDEAALKGDTKKFGLERPVATVKLGSGSSQATLAVGGPAEEGTVYARDLSRPAVFTIESTLVEDLKKDPSEYRQKDLFDARTFNATHLTIAHGGQTHVFEKTKSKNKDGQEEDRWRQTAPQARELDQAAFDTLLSALTGLRAEGFVDASTAARPLAAPELTATVKFADGKKEERVTFARSGNEILAARAGEPGAARLEAPAFEAAVKALQELK